MSAETNTKTIAQVYEAFGRGDVAAILDAVNNDVDWAGEARLGRRSLVRRAEWQGRGSSVLRGIRLDHGGGGVHTGLLRRQRD